MTHTQRCAIRRAQMRKERKIRIWVYVYMDDITPFEGDISIKPWDNNSLCCDLKKDYTIEELFLQLDIRNIKWYKITFRYRTRNSPYESSEGLTYQNKFPKYIYDRYNALIKGDIETYKKTFLKEYKKENSK